MTKEEVMKLKQGQLITGTINGTNKKGEPITIKRVMRFTTNEYQLITENTIYLCGMQWRYEYLTITNKNDIEFLIKQENKRHENALKEINDYLKEL